MKAYKVMVGSGFIEFNSDRGIPVTVYKHPKYIYFEHHSDYDFSLLKLHTVLRFSKRIQPIKMIGFNNEVPSGTNCSMSGWGRTEHGNIPSNLLAANMTIVNRKICETYYNVPVKILTDRMICAGNEKHEACKGTLSLKFI